MCQAEHAKQRLDLAPVRVGVEVGEDGDLVVVAVPIAAAAQDLLHTDNIGLLALITLATAG